VGNGPKRSRRRGARLGGGDVVVSRELTGAAGERVAIPDAERLVHLQFRRFAGCPVCNLHLRAVAQRHDELVEANVREVVVFHSTPQELGDHASGFPFTVVADPGKRLYLEFGVATAPAAMLHPRVWLPELRATIHLARRLLGGEGRLPPMRPSGGHSGLPADFLIGTDGRVLARRYGTHAYDQWSVDELLALARSARATNA
jgi:peroxiredoxin